MSPPSSSARWSTGAEMQEQRSTSRETGQSQRSSIADPESSFASSNGSHPIVKEENNVSDVHTPAGSTAATATATTAREKLGGLGALGAKMRSFSSGARRASARQSSTSSYPTPHPQLQASQSRTSLKEDGKKGKRASRILDAFSGNGRKRDIPFVSTEVPAQGIHPAELPKDEAAANDNAKTNRRRNLSVSKLSDHIMRASHPNSAATSPQLSQATDAGTSQSDFNLRSFRNVRRQSSYFSYNVPVGAVYAGPSTSSPRSSAAYYTTHSPVPLSREESFMSAQESLSPGISPRLEEPFLYSDAGSPPLSTLQIDSKANSPRLDSTRVVQGGSISAGRFRRASSSRLLEEIMNNPGFNALDETGTGPEKYSFMNADAHSNKRPASPFSRYPGSPSETLAALEAGRRTPLMFLHQAGADIDKKQEPGDLTPGADTQARKVQESQTDDEDGGTALPYRQPPPSGWEASVSHARESRESYFPQVSVEPPSSDISAPSALYGSHLDGQPLSASPEGNADSQLRASPEAADDGASLDSKHAESDTKGEAIRHIDHGFRALEGNERRHMRGMSTPLESTSNPLPVFGHRRLSSSTLVQPFASPSLQSRAQELLSFHHKHVPSLSAAHTRTELQPTLIDRIAWPTPPCVKVEYFSQLPAMHQHSLYEQHRKAADHALAEYMRLMAGVAPPEAMIQPQSIFTSDSTLGRNASTASRRHPRSRSISVPGVHGGNLSGRRRSSALMSTTEPVPPLPTSEVIEQLETRAQSGSQIGHSQEKRKSQQFSSPASSPVASHDTPIDRPFPPPRRPSAKFMTPRHDFRAPLDALDGKGSVAAGTSTEGTDSLRRRSAGAV